MKERIWQVRIKETGQRWVGPLEAVWEVACDPISDDYTTSDITAQQLFEKWADYVRPRYSDGLIPIHWFIEGRQNAKFEGAPFDLHGRDHHNFLTYYMWPTDAESGEPLNWLTLPVVDKLWRPGRGDKGGFIQEYTGWKPSMLQPFVYLPSLEQRIAPTDGF